MNKLITSNTLKYYVDVYEILQTFTLDDMAIEILDYIPFTKQYCIVKAFREKLKYKNIIKALNSYSIVRTCNLYEVFDPVEAKRLEESDRPFYGGIVKNKFYLRHISNGSGLVIGSSNVKNFYECITKKCIKCGVFSVVRKKATQCTEDKEVLQSSGWECIACLNEEKEEDEKKKKRKPAEKASNRDMERVKNAVVKYHDGGEDGYCIDCYKPLMFDNLNMACGACGVIQSIQGLGKCVCRKCKVINNMEEVRCFGCYNK